MKNPVINFEENDNFVENDNVISLPNRNVDPPNRNSDNSKNDLSSSFPLYQDLEFDAVCSELKN
jgi:hypothetical protein